MGMDSSPWTWHIPSGGITGIMNPEWCGNCYKHRDEHLADGKCVFEATYFTPRIDSFTVAIGTAPSMGMRVIESDKEPTAREKKAKAKKSLEDFKERLRKRK
jgi:hypothetical protein